jgi:hypothetical protein
MYYFPAPHPTAIIWLYPNIPLPCKTKYDDHEALKTAKYGDNNSKNEHWIFVQFFSIMGRRGR